MKLFRLSGGDAFLADAGEGVILPAADLPVLVQAADLRARPFSERLSNLPVLAEGDRAVLSRMRARHGDFDHVVQGLVARLQAEQRRRAQVGPVATGSAAGEVDAGPDPSGGSARATVMVLEADPRALAALEERLDGSEFALVPWASGLEGALEAYAERPADIVLLGRDAAQWGPDATKVGSALQRFLDLDPDCRVVLCLPHSSTVPQGARAVCGNLADRPRLLEALRDALGGVRAMVVAPGGGIWRSGRKADQLRAALCLVLGAVLGLASQGGEAGRAALARQLERVSTHLGGEVVAVSAQPDPNDYTGIGSAGADPESVRPPEPSPPKPRIEPLVLLLWLGLAGSSFIAAVTVVVLLGLCNAFEAPHRPETQPDTSDRRRKAIRSAAGAVVGSLAGTCWAFLWLPVASPALELFCELRRSQLAAPYLFVSGTGPLCAAMAAWMIVQGGRRERSRADSTRPAASRIAAAADGPAAPEGAIAIAQSPQGRVVLWDANELVELAPRALASPTGEQLAGATGVLPQVTGALAGGPAARAAWRRIVVRAGGAAAAARDLGAALRRLRTQARAAPADPGTDAAYGSTDGEEPPGQTIADADADASLAAPVKLPGAWRRYVFPFLGGACLGTLLELLLPSWSKAFLDLCSWPRHRHGPLVAWLWELLIVALPTVAAVLVAGRLRPRRQHPRPLAASAVRRAAGAACGPSNETGTYETPVAVEVGFAALPAPLRAVILTAVALGILAFAGILPEVLLVPLVLGLPAAGALAALW